MTVCWLQQYYMAEDAGATPGVAPSKWKPHAAVHILNLPEPPGRTKKSPMASVLAVAVAGRQLRLNENFLIGQ